ncbi:hypothetical protein KC19_VG051600 [Ceratodon purpureus]|uniref:Kinesin motor domain-containing protein n=1 Tax=Ceratodon purpureus TaxID=3225 RepID=A0A8T0HM69_CERPU|nr:hypothetical protein KC19_VG051600 [Ceratodon purpureus]KAG0571894.1 hypothetical protein KC19_VG051600 [Ceratodon purpureus]
MEKIFVSIRVRPLSKVEGAKGSPWKLGSNSIALCNPSGAIVPGQSYVFDKVFGSETSTLEIYETHTKDIIASAVAGFNGTVFAYGQTSSGKTYTMRGSPQEPGIIPLAVQEIFKNIQEAEGREFLLRVSYMEIYNEEINDLLAPENRKLQVHENIEKGVFVAGLREEIVVSPEQVLDLMTAGETYRHVGETNMNVYSSRSHSIFRMVIESRDKSHDDPAGPSTVQSCDAVRVSVLNLVDLAGSERVAKTGAEGARLREGTHINKSLMTLGTVINKLSEGVEKQGGHVPYRDSKLTRILQPALGGNAKTAVICNITPAQIHVDETKGTLFFASRANRVTNCAQVNEIMTDAALLKRQKKEIEELRNKLQENHSDHWDAEILNLRNALLKTELERERMALELQQEKKAQAERERRLKEQEQKIENLSTMVINFAVDDRDLDRRNKKNNRRETWCPRIPSTEPDIKPLETKKPFPKESPLAKSMFSTRRERLPPLPPPFESLVEGEETVPPLLELDENAFGEEFQSFPLAGSNLDSIFQEPPPVFFCERKRRSSEKPVDEELRQQLGELQAQYDDFQLQHELLQHEMREKVLEMKELKEELVTAQSAVNKARKLDNGAYQSEDRRGKSLDGWESDGKLRAQIQNLELEKIYMQKELDTLKVQSGFQLQKELEEAREDGANAKVDLSIALQQITNLQHEQQLGLDQQAALAAHFNELTLEVETTRTSSQAFFQAAVDSTDVLRATLMNLQESIVDVKSLRAAAENQHFGRLQYDLDASVKEHDSLFSVLHTVEKERDAFCEVSKQAQAGLKSLEEEIRGKSNELEETAAELLAANKHIVDAGNEIAELQSLLQQHESQQEALEQNIRELQSEALGLIPKSYKEKLDERIAELEQELELVSQEKASLVCKGDAMHATIQVLEGERDALIETSKQAQADMDRLQGKRRQELKEAQNKLELALSESHHAKEQLLGMRSLLTEKTEEQQALQFKLENLQREATTSTRTLEESVRTLETEVTQKSTELEFARREYGELVASHEALNREKCEISEACSRSEAELNRLCRELDSQGQELAEAVRRLGSGRTQKIEDEKQLSELHLTLLNRNVEIETLKLRIANLTAEKSAMETCLAGHSPESINTVLVEKSVKLSNAECSLQANIAELEKIKLELALLQESRATLESELAESKTYSVAVEETLSEAVSTLEAKNQENMNLKADLENALKESELKSAKLADIENECVALVESMESIKLEMEDAKVAWDQEVQNQKESIEAASIEQLALVEECKALRSALVSLEEEREVLKEQNFQAETELKEFDVEVQRQRQEIEVAERELELAKHESMRAAEVTADLREAFSQKTDEIVFLQTQIEAFCVKTTSLEDDLDKKTRELELAQQREDTLTLQLSGAQQRLSNLETQILEKEEKRKVLSEDLSSLEAEYSSMREDINCKVAEMEQLVQLTSTERAVLVEKNEVAVVGLQRVEEERAELLKIIRELKEESEQLKVLLGDEESQSRDAKSKITSASTHIHELEELLAKKNAEIEQLEQEKIGLVESLTATEISRREELESKIQALQTLLSEKTAELEQVQQENVDLIIRMTALEHSLKAEIAQRHEEVQALSAQKTSDLEQAKLEKNGLVEKMTASEQTLRYELEKKIQDLVAAVSRLEAVNLEVHEKLKQSELCLRQCIEEKERTSRENEVLIDGSKQLQDRMSCLEQESEQHQNELRQLERRLASANTEIDDAGNQLNDVHALLTENQKERLVLQQSLEELEKCKAVLQESLSAKDTDLRSTATALSEIKSKFEALQQQHNTESSQLKSDILGLRKELKAAKAAPASLEKERDGLRKDLEKLKTKSGDIEAKLKSTLIEKSKVETEKLNIEREVKQLRQSTALLNKRESIVDKRRESVACGLNKTKLQLSSTEHALQMKTNELEKTSFDLQLLQDNYAKLEADMLKTENALAILKERLADAENALSVLRDENGTATSTIEKITQVLEEELEQKRAIIAQLDALHIEHTAMTEKSLTFQVASEKADAEAKSISLERDDFARQLVDTHVEFEKEKAEWVSKVDLSNAKVQELQQEIVTLTEELRKVQKAQDELLATRNTLQEQLDEAEHTATSARVALEEQLSKMEHCLESSLHESKELKQQVELLNFRIEEQVQSQRKLEEEAFVGKEQYKSLTEEFEKLKDVLVESGGSIQKEKQFTMDLAEEIKQLKSMLHSAEQNCADLHERNSDFEAAVRKESDERMQLLDERRALVETVQSQTDRCVVLEGQISESVITLREGSDNNSRLLKEIQELKEKLHNNLEGSTQVERLQFQLKMSHTENESHQTELDDVGMKVKSLYLEVNDLQAALDQSRTEKFALKQQLSDLSARLSNLEDKNEQLQKKETHLLQLNKTYLTSQCKLKVALKSTGGRLEYFQTLCEKMEEAIRELDDLKSAAKKENADLLVIVKEFRSRCQRYEEELNDAKNNRTSPGEEQERETQIADLMQQNSALQQRLAKADENAKARQEEITKLYEVVQRKEESTAKLEAALEKCQGQVLKLERDLYLEIEPQTARNIHGSTMPSGEFTTPVASRQEQGDENLTDDTVILYSNSLASRSKVEQLKLQSQNLLRMAANRQPWRIQGSPIDSMDEADDHPPPSATLHSHHENLTGPIPTWKRARTSGAASITDFPQPSNSAFSEDKLLASSFNTRSAPRAALVPVTQNKLQLGLKRRLQETASLDKPAVQGVDEAGTKPSLSGSQMPRNFRFNQKFEKENL